MATVVIFDEGKVTVSNTEKGTVATYNPEAGTTPIYVGQLNAPAPKDAKVGDRILGADGNMYTVVAHSPSALESMMYKVVGVNEVADKPPVSGDGREPRKVTLRPGDDLPIPGPKEIILATLDHPLGIGSYGWKVPAGVSGSGWIKGRSVGGDNFSVRYALGIVAVGDAQLGSPVGSMELPINFDGDEKGGMSNTGPGFNGKLTLDNVSGQPMLLQITRA